MTMKWMMLGVALACGSVQAEKVLCTNALTTVWGRAVTAANAWREYPRPQLVRTNWTSLNGDWDYAVTSVTTDEPRAWEGKIRVPYPIESPLSGVERKVSPREQIWYHRTFTVAPSKNTRTILHFERVDFRASVFVNGTEATDVPHEGGNVPFEMDITDLLKSGTNELKVLVWDPTDTFVGGTGKQVLNLRTCFFGPVSGICGSVWLETVPATYLADWQVKTDVDRGTVTFIPAVKGRLRTATFAATVSYKGQALVSKAGPADEPLTLALPAPRHLWSCETPNLYDVAFTVTSEGVTDRTTGYFGFRKVETKLDARGVRRVAINGKFTYLLATLDQGWWPDGLLTPPSEAACRFDVDFHKKAGFNAIRKHIKIEPRAFYAHCDRTGIMVLQDIPSSAADNRQSDLEFANQRYAFARRELKDCVDHLRNHPCIVMWNPYNEGWGQPSADKTRYTNKWLRRYDPSRLVNGPSGWNDYEGGTAWSYTKWAYADVSDSAVYTDCVDRHNYPHAMMHPAGSSRVSIAGEFGGMGVALAGHVQSVSKYTYTLTPVDNPSWRAKQQARYAQLMKPLPDLIRAGLGGSVYTEAQDQFWELGGFVTFDRALVKLDYAFLRKIHQHILDVAREAAETPPPPPPKGLSIAWTLSPVWDHGEWPRIHRLSDGRWAYTYSRNIGLDSWSLEMIVRYSSDQGRSWSAAQTVVPRVTSSTGTNTSTTHWICNPELVELPATYPHHPGRLIASVNLRAEPHATKVPSSIGVSVSDDRGRTWRPLQKLLPLVGEAGVTVARRCWEPFVQALPDGTLHLYYTDMPVQSNGRRGERRIARFVSTDGGDSWTGPEDVLAQPGYSSSIPSALLFRNQLYLAHEAALDGDPRAPHQPCIARFPLAGGASAKPVITRAPFDVPLAKDVYCGAPYLVQTDNYFVLSSQTAPQQGPSLASTRSDLGVWLLPKRAVNAASDLKGFVRVSNPLGQVHGIWSSLTPLDNDEVLAVCQSGNRLLLARGVIQNR